MKRNSIIIGISLMMACASIAQARPGILNQQHSMGSEVNLGTIVFEKYSKKMGYRNIKPQGLDIGQISRLSSEIAYGSCLSSQIAVDITKTFNGRTFSESDLGRIIESRLPNENQVFVWKKASSQMTGDDLKQALAMNLMVKNFRKDFMAGESRYQAALRTAHAKVNELEAPSTIEEAQAIAQREMGNVLHKNEINILNASSVSDPNTARIDRTGLLKDVFKNRFEKTYFNIGSLDSSRMSPQGAITKYQSMGGALMPTEFDQTLAFYTSGSIHAMANGDFDMSALQCTLTSRSGAIQLICPSSGGEIYNGGGQNGIYCGTKTTITQTNSGQFQILDPNL